MKTKTRELLTVPTQMFEPGEIGDNDYETPIQFQAYEFTLVLSQEGQEINIPPQALEPLIKALRNFKKECYPQE